MNAEQYIAASREQVWAALNDPEILKAAMPGCESFDATGENTFEAKITAKVGPVKAKFKFNVSLSDIDPPNAYTISGEGKGGAAGFARGSATVNLKADGDGTLLAYSVNANVGGKLAQLGSRLIDGAAKKMADEFFGNFVTLLVGEEAPDESSAQSQASDATADQGKPAGTAIPGFTWAVLAVLAAALLWSVIA